MYVNYIGVDVITVTKWTVLLPVVSTCWCMSKFWRYGGVSDQRITEICLRRERWRVRRIKHLHDTFYKYKNVRVRHCTTDSLSSTNITLSIITTWINIRRNYIRNLSFTLYSSRKENSRFISKYKPWCILFTVAIQDVHDYRSRHLYFCRF